MESFGYMRIVLGKERSSPLRDLKFSLLKKVQKWLLREGE